MKSDTQAMQEFHAAIDALTRAQVAEGQLFTAIGEMPPETVPATLSDQWYQLNQVSIAARARVDAAVRALCKSQ